MPKLSDTREEGTIVEWKKSSGDEVHKGDVLAEVESDKATFDLEAEDDGTLEIIVEKGVPAKIGAPIARIGEGAPAEGKKEQPPATNEGEATKAEGPKAEAQPAKGPKPSNPAEEDAEPAAKAEGEPAGKEAPESTPDAAEKA